MTHKLKIPSKELKKIKMLIKSQYLSVQIYSYILYTNFQFYVTGNCRKKRSVYK